MFFRSFSKGIRIFCLSIFALSIYGCTPVAPIRIGFAAELTGKQSELAINLRDGIQLAVEEINAAGGINRRPIELVIEDDLGTPQGAEEAANKLIDASVIAILGNMTSNQNMAAYPVAESRGVLFLSATASTSVMSGKKDLFYRTTPSTDTMGRGFAWHIRKDHNLTRIAIIADQDNNLYSDPMMQAFEETFNSMGGQIPSMIKFSGTTSPDLSPLVDNLRISKPEGVLIIASPLMTATIAQQIYIKDWSTALFASSWAQGDALIQNGGKAVEGMEIIIAFDVNHPAPELQVFKTNFQNRFIHPALFSGMEGYETMQMLAAALQKTGGDAKGLSEALLGLKDFKGLTGIISMDEYGDAVRPLYIMWIKNHKFETKTTINPTY